MRGFFYFRNILYLTAMRPKSVISLVKDLDVGKREVVFAFSAFGNYDADNDRILPGAFAKTITENGPNGTDRIKHLYNHERKTLPPIGKVLEMWQDGEYAYAKSKLRDTQMGNDILKGYEEGIYKEHSFWGEGINPSKNEKGGYDLKEVKLYEVSTVLWGANSNTPLIALSKGLDVVELEKELASLRAFVKNGKASDEFIKEIEMEVAKLSDVVRTLSEKGRDKAPESKKPLTAEQIALLYYSL